MAERGWWIGVPVPVGTQSTRLIHAWVRGNVMCSPSGVRPAVNDLSMYYGYQRAPSYYIYTVSGNCEGCNCLHKHVLRVDKH